MILRIVFEAAVQAVVVGFVLKVVRKFVLVLLVIGFRSGRHVIYLLGFNLVMCQIYIPF